MYFTNDVYQWVQWLTLPLTYHSKWLSSYRCHASIRSGNQLTITTVLALSTGGIATTCLLSRQCGLRNTNVGISHPSSYWKHTIWHYLTGLHVFSSSGLCAYWCMSSFQCIWNTHRWCVANIITVYYVSSTCTNSTSRQSYMALCWKLCVYFHRLPDSPQI